MNKIQSLIVFAGALCVCNAGHAQEPYVQNPDVQTQNSLQQQLTLAPKLPLIMEVFGEYQEGLGSSVLSAGDVNGDGWLDFGVSAYKPGELRIYLGGPGILDSVPDLVLQRGGRNAVLADINGDGIEDLVTVKQNNFWDTAFFYLGRKELPLRYQTEPDLRFIPAEWSEDFGLSLQAGDFNRDGFTDIALADRSGGGGEGHGQANGIVYIFMGKTFPDAVPEFILSKAIAYNNEFGNRLQIGDVNGDGYDDLAVGREYENYDVNPDIVFNSKYLFLGSPKFYPMIDQPSQIVESNILFGNLMNGALSDVNADGNDDLVFSNDNNGNVLYGTTSGWASTIGKIIPRPGALGWGGMIRLHHDITGDGFIDYVLYLLTFDQSWASFFYGSKLGVTHEFAYNGNYEWEDDYADPARNRVCSIGDVNGDGRNDVLVSGTGTPGRRGVFQILSGIGPPVAAEQLKATPEVLAITSVRPNPSYGPVEMDLNTPASSVVRVTVHDAFGRELRVISDAHHIPGTHTLRWNGHDAFGSRVPSGVYLLRATSGCNTVTGRVVMR